jgi:hypothetical protein
LPVRLVLTAHTHFQRLLLWLYLYQKYKKTAVETDVAGNVDIKEKPLWNKHLRLIFQAVHKGDDLCP